ncbi:MAG: NDP-sugar synthase [Bdellovibrio sp.]|nr:NDP-sugar synthase [Bdellovibrio sp.]
MNVMLLAAGEGTRLRPYTEILPKPAIPFLTIPLAAHALSFLRGFTIDTLVVNTFHLPHRIHELFHTLPHKAKALHFSDEVEKILGSGGGLGKAREHFIGGGDFLMMNADEVILSEDADTLKIAMANHKKHKPIATLMVMEHPAVGTQFGGVWTDANGKVLGFGKTALPGSTKGWHFVGAQILSDRVFKYIPLEGESNILYDSLTKALADGETVEIHPFKATWFETGNPKDFLHASEECFKYLFSAEDSYQKKTLIKNLKDFSAKPVSFAKTDHAQVVYTEDAQISPSAKLSGIVTVGSGCVIKDGVELKNVIVGNGATVIENTIASDKIFI